MFTGIVEDIGKVAGVSRKKDTLKLDILAEKICGTLRIGDSVACNGACLTVTAIKKSVLSFDVMKPTYEKTDLRDLNEGDRVNLERALKADARLGGHFVTGHIDGVRKIIRCQRSRASFIEIGLEAGDNEYVVKNGSVCIDGASLTISGVSAASLRVDLIPHTLDSTTLGSARQGDTVNIEFDILLKAAKIKDNSKKQTLTRKTLEEAGFI